MIPGNRPEDEEVECKIELAPHELVQLARWECVESQKPLGQRHFIYDTVYYLVDQLADKDSYTDDGIIVIFTVGEIAAMNDFLGERFRVHELYTIIENIISTMKEIPKRRLR
jgi:hypothetical protein